MAWLKTKPHEIFYSIDIDTCRGIDVNEEIVAIVEIKSAHKYEEHE
ncbi:hypothetical protein PCIT_a4172 [Pseudoalteromonas citrea]|uniref:Uncharacterized protein n=1 Tax=Pseudoalteromonas citrea TaxID=43655 RepID=A0AAD4FRV9_9GAMM|nr:hypothetical protein PCIT_a4172 [Pseudoalteromonas citrea]